MVASSIMLQEENIPSFAKLVSRDVEEGYNGQLAMERHLAHIERLIHEGYSTIMIQAGPGSGKSRLVPKCISRHLANAFVTGKGRGKLLVVTPAKVDVKSLYHDASRDGFQCCYRMGNNDHDGFPIPESDIVFATAGLVQQWLVQHSVSVFDDFDAVFFDEFHNMEQSPGYALLWEAALDTQKRPWRSFIIVGASATFGSSLKERVDQFNVAWIHCRE